MPSASESLLLDRSRYGPETRYMSSGARLQDGVPLGRPLTTLTGGSERTMRVKPLAWLSSVSYATLDNSDASFLLALVKQRIEQACV